MNLISGGGGHVVKRVDGFIDGMYSYAGRSSRALDSSFNVQWSKTNKDCVNFNVDLS